LTGTSLSSVIRLATPPLPDPFRSTWSSSGFFENFPTPSRPMPLEDLPFRLNFKLFLPFVPLLLCLLVFFPHFASRDLCPYLFCWDLPPGGTFLLWNQSSDFTLPPWVDLSRPFLFQQLSPHVPGYAFIFVQWKIAFPRRARCPTSVILQEDDSFFFPPTLPAPDFS